MTWTHKDTHRRILSICLLGVLSASAYGQSYDKRAPYTQIVWSEEEERPRVRLRDTWYTLEAINGLATEALIDFARRTYADRWQKRFDEDLVEVLTRMGHPPEETVRLTLFDAEARRSLTLEAVPMTGANRQAIIASKYPQRRDQAQARPDVTRRVLTQEEVEADLDAFERLLQERFAYLKMHHVDYHAALASIRQRARQGMPALVFARELQKVFGLFIDGHAGLDVEVPGGYLPFLIRPAGNRFVAFMPDRTGFLDEAHPYITQLDGKPLAEWINTLAPYIAKGSPQYVTHQVLRRLRTLQFVRPLMGITNTDQVQVALASADGQDVVTKVIDLSDKSPIYGTWPIRESQVLEDNIGYLRLASMDEEAVEAVNAWMPRFRDTEGLIIDVRGNGGGSRDALLEVFPYFMTPDDAPYIANVAAYRLYNGFGEDHLEARFMYRADAPRWREAERSAIEAFMQAFDPEWIPPADDFSAWHYLVLSKKQDDPRYHYDNPVVVLLDDRCFSATDIFLGAFKGWRKVTLMGTPSGGGSARSVGFALPHSGLQGRMASMASFQRNGKLYDGNGIQPDVELEPSPAYYIQGGHDHSLEYAIAFLKDP